MRILGRLQLGEQTVEFDAIVRLRQAPRMVQVVRAYEAMPQLGALLALRTQVPQGPDPDGPPSPAVLRRGLKDDADDGTVSSAQHRPADGL